MLQLLKIEWLKVKNYTTFWVLSVLYFVSVFGANYITWLFWDARPKDNGMTTAIIGNPFNFPDVWHMIAYTSSFLMFMPGLLIIISFTNEYSFKTHRQNIIDGWTRLQFMQVKIALTVIVSLVATLVVFLVAFFFGLALSKSAFAFTGIEFIGYFFIQALSYSLVALLFGLLFKRSGIAIGVYFLYTVILENTLAGFLNKYGNNIGRYLPLETTDNLIQVPVFRAIVSQLFAPYNLTALLGMSAIYIVAYCALALWRFQNDDL